MRSTEAPEPISEADIELLDEFLASESARQNCFGISDLDGFLTGVAIGPELIRPSEWLPIIWGGEEPAFDDTRK